MHGRAIAFSLLALSPLFHAFNCRSATASIFTLRPAPAARARRRGRGERGDPPDAVLVPGLRPVFRTFSLTVPEWTILLVLSASIIPAVEILKLGERLLGRQK